MMSVLRWDNSVYVPHTHFNVCVLNKRAGLVTISLSLSLSFFVFPHWQGEPVVAQSKDKHHHDHDPFAEQ